MLEKLIDNVEQFIDVVNTYSRDSESEILLHSYYHFHDCLLELEYASTRCNFQTTYSKNFKQIRKDLLKKATLNYDINSVDIHLRDAIEQLPKTGYYFFSLKKRSLYETQLHKVHLTANRLSRIVQVNIEQNEVLNAIQELRERRIEAARRGKRFILQ